MKKRGFLITSVLVITMALSIPAWAEETPVQSGEENGGLSDLLLSEDGVIENLLSGNGAVSSLFGDEKAKETIEGLFGENGALAGILPEEIDIDEVLQTVGSQLEDAGSTLHQGISSVAEMVTDEVGSFDWEKAGDSINELIGLFAGGGTIENFGTETDQESGELDLEALLAEIMIPYEKADAVMFDYLAERNAEFMDAGDAQIFSKKTGYMDDPEEDEFKVLGEFTQVNFNIDGDQMNMVSAATDTLLLTLTKGEDGIYTVTDEKRAEDGEGYEASLEALCEEVGIPVDDFYASTVLGAYNDAEALADYLDEHQEIASAEFQGEQMTAEELHKLAEDYSNSLWDSIFGESEEEEAD